MKANLIAKKLNLKDDSIWINKELDGYNLDSEIPPYRKTFGELKAKHPGQGLIPCVIPDTDIENLIREVRISESISEIEKINQCSPTEGYISMSLSGKKRLILQKIFQSDLEMILLVPHTIFEKICDSVRKALLDWSINLEIQGILGENLSFTDEEKRKVVAGEQTLHININAPVNGAIEVSQNNAGGSKSTFYE